MKKKYAREGTQGREFAESTSALYETKKKNECGNQEKIVERESGRLYKRESGDPENMKDWDCRGEMSKSLGGLYEGESEDPENLRDWDCQRMEIL